MNKSIIIGLINKELHKLEEKNIKNYTYPVAERIKELETAKEELNHEYSVLSLQSVQS